MSPNTQTPLARSIETDRVLVHSIWPTIQGEGPFAGTMAVFIRLVGCNLQCPWCDTEYTQKKELFLYPKNELDDLEDLDKLLSRIRKFTPIRNRFTVHQKQLVVITGGEPFRQNINPLLSALVSAGLTVQIETNGTLWWPDIPHSPVIVCSPKTPKIDPRLAARANAFKYILDSGHISPEDGLPVGTLGKYGQTARPPDGWEGEIYVQPLDQQDFALNQSNLQACVVSVLRFGYRLCIQTHKLANVP